MPSKQPHSTAQRRRQKERNMRFRLIALGVALVFAIIVHFFGGQYGIPTWDELYDSAGLESDVPIVAPPASGETQIHFIDVGQGDAVLLAQGGEYALIDAGVGQSEEVLRDYFAQLGITELAYIVMTHPHADHIGSMNHVILDMGLTVGTVILPDFALCEQYPTSKTFERVLEAIEETNTTAETAVVGASYPMGEGVLEILSAGVETDNFNDISVCNKFTAGAFSYVSTGDAEEAVEAEMLARGVDLSAQVFKAGHHGSSSSNSLAFMKAVNPEIIVISCGLDNDYGHPHWEVLETYKKIRAQVYRTHLMGSVVVTASSEGELSVVTAKEAA